VHTHRPAIAPTAVARPAGHEQRTQGRNPSRDRPATSLTLTGSAPLAHGKVAYTVQLRGAPSTMLAQNRAALESEARAAITAVLGGAGGAVPANLNIVVDVDPSKLLGADYVTGLVRQAVTAQLLPPARAPAAPQRPAAAPQRPPADAKRPEPAVGAPVLEEVGREALATFGPAVTSAARMVTGIVPSDEERIAKARGDFRARHGGYDAQELDRMDQGLRQMTAGNPDLLIAYYEYYASHQLSDTADVAASRKGALAKTSGGDTRLNPNVVSGDLDPSVTDDPVGVLGGTLLHEYVHTSQRSGGGAGDEIDEAKAYGTEYFFTERAGKDRTRLDFISQRESADQPINRSFDVPERFDNTQRVLAALYAVIDGKPAPAGVSLSRAQAQALVVDFLSHDSDGYSPELQAVMKATIRGDIP
jgi:hypothetical protein